ncbi:MAG: glycine rich domain-containing protein, partial [Oscillospiraceae bacterium]|nr:glycine rich domain-containing protein [Oscillospiraceae bacterium]
METKAELLSGATGWTDTSLATFMLRVDPDHEVMSNEEWDFIHTGGRQEWIVPQTGLYRLEVWGADGGPVPNSIFNGRGGYSAGTVQLTQGETLYIYVGGRGEASLGTNHINAGGFNGGGDGRNSSGASPTVFRTGGGGASDIRAVADTLNNRIIVSGGGGGNSGHSTNMTAGNGG